MPSYKQKGIIESFRLRIKKKYNNISEETENLSHLLQTCLLQFNSRVSELIEKEDNDFYSLYQKLNQDLENYREKLFHVQTIIENTLTEEATSDFRTSIQDVSDDSYAILPEKSVPVRSISCETTDKIEKLVDLKAHPSVSSKQISLLKDSAVLENQISNVSGSTNLGIASVNRDIDVAKIGIVSHQISCDQEGSEKSFSHSSCYRSFSSNFSDIYTEETPSSFPEKDSKVTENCVTKSETEHVLNKIESQTFATPTIPLSNVIVPSNFSAFLTHIIDPGNFWLQLENFNELNYPVSDYVQQKSLSHVEEGIFCLARFKSTSFYYRAKVLASRNWEGKVKVLFIDHGSTEDVSPNDLRPLPWAAYDVHWQAINCFLLGVSPIGSNWSPESIQRFKEFQCYSIKTQVLYKLNDKYGVKLIANVSEDFNEDFSTDVAQSLYLDNLAIEGSIGPCNSEILNILDESSSFEKQCDKYASSSENRIFVFNDNKISCDSGVSVTYTDKSGQNNSTDISCDSVHHSLLPLSASKETFDFHSGKTNEFSENNIQNEGNDLISFESFENLDDIDDATNEVKNSVAVEEFQTAESSCYNSDFSLNLVVPPPKLSFVEQNMMLVMSSHIVSPAEFYVNMAMENSSNLDDLREQMTSTYDALSQNMLPISEKDIVENMFCAVRYDEDGSWYRAKVLHFSLEDKRKEVVVQYVDWGNSVTMGIHNLYPLSLQFAKHPAFALKCCLAGCTPKKTKCDNNQSLKGDWNEQAINLFKELIRPERCFTAQLFQDQHEQHGETVPVWLWDTEGSEDLLINSALVAKGVANFDNTAVRQLLLQEKFKKCNEADILSEWDPMSEEFHSIENSYGVPIEDLEVATLGYKPKDGDYTCKYFALRGSCPRGTDCPFLHVPLTESGITRDQEEVYSFDNVISLPEGARNVLLEVSSVFTPGHFYGIFPFGTKDVNELDSLVVKGLSNEELINKEAQCLFYAMNKHYSEAAFDENTTVALPYGNIVAAKRKHDNKWHRGRVIDVHDIAGPIEIFFVDFGHKEWVPRKYIRKILTQYLHAPFQAVECSLADVVPKGFEKGKSWSLEATNFFKEWTSEELLLAEIKYRCGHVLKVTLRKTSKYNHAFISELLVNKGYAQFQNTSHSQIKESLYVPG